jgi:hypothetical protein
MAVVRPWTCDWYFDMQQATVRQQKRKRKMKPMLQRLIQPA